VAGARSSVRLRYALLAGAVGAGLCLTVPAFAQSGANTEDAAEEIIVTARKREETAMQAPVILQVISQDEIKTQRITSIPAIASAAPGLLIVPGTGHIGSVAFLRGIGSGNTAAFIDQSVGLNIDGIGFSHGTFYKSGAFDLAQIEILKGPQGLFFGKSTTAGIISLKTADPTSDWEVEVSTGYEVVADEAEVSGHVAGPLTDNLGIRVAGFYNRMTGYVHSPNPDPNVDQRLGGRSVGGRLTLAYDGADGAFRAKLKIGGLKERSHQVPGPTQQSLCIGPKPQNLPTALYDNCKLDKFSRGLPNAPAYNPNYNWLASFANTPENNAAFATGSPLAAYGDGKAYGRLTTLLAMLQMDYDFADGLTITSVSGYGYVNSDDLAGQGYFGLNTPFISGAHRTQNDFSQEVRLSSDWDDSAVNFVAGALYAPSKTHVVTDVTLPANRLWTQPSIRQKTRDFSAFGQFIVTPAPKLEINLGGRYTRAKKYFSELSTVNNVLVPSNGLNYVPLLPRSSTRIAQKNFSPEFTASYKATDDLMFFGSYKEGYKGPGFNVNAFSVVSFLASQPSPFGGEKTKGFEGGVKASLLDRTLNVTVTAYRYRYIGLQVSNFNAITQTTDVNNGANAVTKGVELTASYRPAALRGLRLDGNFAYNRARYTSYPGAPCYSGQSVAAGCTANPQGVLIQNLAGQVLVQAPEAVGALGFDYETEAFGNHKIGFAGRVNHTSGFWTTPQKNPLSYQKAYTTLDASARFGSADDAWEVALIGRNLTNKYYQFSAIDSGIVTPGVIGDIFVTTARPRQLMLQLTVRPTAFD
jgi:iron complex outermembrane receptor protein